ncbi:hypothetical protein DM02DRAFT_709153 [Periconia macrospinosa]|uniref:F-box domain-containing protein n=1 Tax=Periconia macrospinosa TaxID=97972 RepID=A0A2V1DPI5_9PLEO|nr:hypothetical protein DM02DRAFT_709153 [Periconia macrospinosa]
MDSVDSAAWQELEKLRKPFSITRETPVHDLDEYTFRAPRPGLFLGDFPARSEKNRICLVKSPEKSADQMLPQQPIYDVTRNRLEALSPELICAVVPHLDIFSLFSFWATSRTLKNVIEAWPAFRRLTAFPRLLSSAIALQCRFWTVGDLIRCIQDERCACCGEFGDIMYLVTPERWCLSCFLKVLTLVVYPEETQIPGGQETLDALKRVVSHVHLVPGAYGAGKPHGKVHDAYLVFDLRALEPFFPAPSHWMLPWKLFPAPSHLKLPWKLFPNSVDWMHCLKPYESRPFRYTTIVRAPYWNKLKLRFEEGLMCRACSSQCRVQMSSFPAPDNSPEWGRPGRRYSETGLGDHIRQYGAIVKTMRDDGRWRYFHYSQLGSKPVGCQSSKDRALTRSMSREIDRASRGTA